MPTKSELQAMYQELRDENDKLRKDASEVFIEELVLKGGTFDATMKTGIGPVLAVFVRETMRACGAENFYTTTLSFGDGNEAYYITAGRAFGKSVDEKYSEKCIEFNKLADWAELVKRQYQELVDWCNGPHGNGDKLTSMFDRHEYERRAIKETNHE
jgi:hypothetical protein